MPPPRHAGACLITLLGAISIPRPRNNPHRLQQRLRLAALPEYGDGLIHQVVPEFAELFCGPRVGSWVPADVIVVVLHRFSPSHVIVVVGDNCSPRWSFPESYRRLGSTYLSGDKYVSILSCIEQKPAGHD